MAHRAKQMRSAQHAAVNRKTKADKQMTMRV
nr:MAG TPA_asm: hypothetical protein [Caudoviricetes sp.]